METLRQDVRYALRSFAKSPGFTAVVVMTLALGIGANAAIFGLMDQVMFRLLPVRDPGGLTAVAAVPAGDPSKSNATPFPISYRELQDYRTSDAFASLAGYSSARIVTLQQSGGTENLFAELVTYDYFPTLGLTPAKGRFFLPDEDRDPGSSPVAVLNYGTWQTRFAARADIVGGAIKINNIDFTIIGVAPPRFIGVNAIFGPDLWIPATMTETIAPVEWRNALSDRAKGIFNAVGRLNPGVSRAQAQAKMTVIAHALAHEFPKTNEGRGVVVRPLSDVLLNSNSSGASAAR